jgi:putative membrane protein
MLRSKLAILGALYSLTAALGACAHDDSKAMPPQAANTAPSTPPEGPAPSDSTMSSLDGGWTGQPGMANQPSQPGSGMAVGSTNQQSSPPSDEDIAAIIETINKSEVDAGKLARSKAQSGDVKSFAAMMVSDHSTALQQETSLASKEHLMPNTSNSTCQSLTTDAQQEADSLQQKSGQDFDRAYIDAMVQGHQKALGMLDDTLIPNAKDAQLKAHLVAVRAHVEMHLRKATVIQQRLSGNTSPQSLPH